MPGNTFTFTLRGYQMCFNPVEPSGRFLRAVTLSPLLPVRAGDGVRGVVYPGWCTRVGVLYPGMYPVLHHY